MTNVIISIINDGCHAKQIYFCIKSMCLIYQYPVWNHKIDSLLVSRSFPARAPMHQDLSSAFSGIF